MKYNEGSSLNGSGAFAAWLHCSAILTVLLTPAVLAQEPPPPAYAPSSLSNLEAREAGQVAELLGLEARIQKLHNLRPDLTGAIDTKIEELALRQEILESIQRASLGVDGVLAELSNERNQLGDLMAILQRRRDRVVGRLNTAALIAGSGIAVAVGATQFPNLSDRTQTVGTAVSIAAGATAAVLSIVALRKQNGPEGRVGRMPNMLAPLLGGTPILNTAYPPALMQYLNSKPVSGAPDRGTRLEQLKAAWVETGRLSHLPAENTDKILPPLTASGTTTVTVTIDQIRDRMAMLGDLMGKVSLMKRDLGFLMRSLATSDGSQ